MAWIHLCFTRWTNLQFIWPFLGASDLTVSKAPMGRAPFKASSRNWAPRSWQPTWRKLCSFLVFRIGKSQVFSNLLLKSNLNFFPFFGEKTNLSWNHIILYNLIEQILEFHELEHSQNGLSSSNIDTSNLPYNHHSYHIEPTRKGSTFWLNSSKTIPLSCWKCPKNAPPAPPNPKGRDPPQRSQHMRPPLRQRAAKRPVTATSVLHSLQVWSYNIS